MSQQVKRAPGRPKKVQQEAPEQVTVKTPSIKWKEPVEQKSKAVEFEMISKGGIAYILPQKATTIYDESKNTVRSIRYCPNEPSIYVDEQSENAVVEAIVFRNGRLFVTPDKPNLIAYLHAHPQNVANGGDRFAVVDKKKDAEQEIEKEFRMMDAVSMVREKDIVDLVAVAMYFNIDVSRKSQEIRFDLLRIAKRDPNTFIEAFDSPLVKTSAVIRTASDFDILKLKKDGCYWTDSNQMIVATPAGMKTLDVMTRFCLTEKGSIVLSKITELVDKL